MTKRLRIKKKTTDKIKKEWFNDIICISATHSFSNHQLLGFLLAMTRCQASAVAVSVAIAVMLQKKKRHFNRTGGYNIPSIIQDSYDIAVKFIEIEEQVCFSFCFFKI